MSEFPPGPLIPQDLRDLIVRIDGKVDGIMSAIVKQDMRTDNHELRLRSIEVDLGDRPAYKVRFGNLEQEVGRIDNRVSAIETTAKTVTKMGGMIWAVCGAGGLAVAGFIIKLLVTGSL